MGSQRCGARRIGEVVLGELIRPRSFWKKLSEHGDTEEETVPPDCPDALPAALPPGTTNVRMRPRVAGVGSLGRARFVAIGDWNGGRIAREAKPDLAARPSDWLVKAARVMADLTVDSYKAWKRAARDSGRKRKRTLGLR